MRPVHENCCAMMCHGLHIPALPAQPLMVHIIFTLRLEQQSLGINLGAEFPEHIELDDAISADLSFFAAPTTSTTEFLSPYDDLPYPVAGRYCLPSLQSKTLP
jgi:hypothetical protein